MRYFNQIIIGAGFFCSSFAYAIDFYADALYWQASETVDWALTNNLRLPNQIIAYKTIDFDFAPGFRIGAGLQKADWNIKAFYTRYSVQAHATTHDNVISAFMPSKFVETFYQSATVKFTIDYSIFDLDLNKSIQVGESLNISPLIGLKGGAINQRINTGYYGLVSVLEQVTNNFTGFGPKIGLESQWLFYNKNALRYSLIADFATSYMWGKWSIYDTLIRNDSAQIGSVIVGKRDLGALSLQGLVGIKMDYKKYSVKIGYEISDWFNQFQVFDNATGTHTNDLVLQGATLAFKYHC
ncbi:hypothetical protein Lmor_3174 [Legionella moravica]|uniref:Major outer membrane protein n=1 Tax=Legionella moravica TaxID=39962 RepID=A0A378K319_9GAMM|nr:Lpg1974 family pore-forming outer membrane protein [Legionella moravica]KTD31067.1 hypothetical protein Lmor_3174 [Legionella moravica]STX63649.1 Uncharacterised protein [Legionella moravica]